MKLFQRFYAPANEESRSAGENDFRAVNDDTRNINSADVRSTDDDRSTAANDFRAVNDEARAINIDDVRSSSDDRRSTADNDFRAVNQDARTTNELNETDKVVRDDKDSRDNDNHPGFIDKVKKALQDWSNDDAADTAYDDTRV